MENNYNICKEKRDYIEDLKEYYLEYHFDEELRKAEQRILALNDPELSYLFAINFKDALVNNHADVVIASNDEDRIYDFICDVKTYDNNHFEEKIIELGNLQVLLSFARYMQDEIDLTRISNIMIDSGDAKYNYLFAKDVKGVDIKAHGQVVINSKDPKFCYTFARDIDIENYLIYEKVVMESKDPKWCYYFMKDIPTINKEELKNIIINSGNLEYISLIQEENNNTLVLKKN